MDMKRYTRTSLLLFAGFILIPAILTVMLYMRGKDLRELEMTFYQNTHKDLVEVTKEFNETNQRIAELAKEYYAVDFTNLVKVVEDELRRLPEGITNAIDPYDVSITNIYAEPSTNWQFDFIRENNRFYAIEQAQAEQWQATNTNNFVYYATLRHHIPFEFITNTIELGYRSDGVVVWRTPPESK